MTLQQLRQVIMIADVGSMNEAAKRLFISQPNLSSVVKDVEEETGITIFLRSNRGIRTTPEGADFISYARQVVDQYQLLQDHYTGKSTRKKFSVSCQHYSFAVEAFVELVRAVGMEEYEFSIHETQTQTVIDHVKNLRSEIGILYLSDFNEHVLTKLFRENGLVFQPLCTCSTCVYLWKGHPLAGRSSIRMEELEPYPCLVFEQGQQNSFYFAEEMYSTFEYKKTIKGDDRATMLNLMVGLDGFTLCSGIISEKLNGSDFIAIPLENSAPMRVGYLTRKGVKLSQLGERYLEKLNCKVKRMEEETMKLIIAGERKEVKDSITVSELIEEEKVETPEYVSVSVNEEFVPRAEFGTHQLVDGDVVEFLYFMGGGR